MNRFKDKVNEYESLVNILSMASLNENNEQPLWNLTPWLDNLHDGLLILSTVGYVKNLLMFKFNYI